MVVSGTIDVAESARQVMAFVELKSEPGDVVELEELLCELASESKSASYMHSLALVFLRHRTHTGRSMEHFTLLCLQGKQ